MRDGFKPALKSIQIASPCTAEWDAMTDVSGEGSQDQVRFCGQCQLNVYNLSGMTTEAATDLIESKEGRLCVRFFQRADGTVLTQDCPVGLELKYRRPAKVYLRGALVALSIATAIGVFSVVSAKDSGDNSTPLSNQMMGAPIPPPVQMTGGMMPPDWSQKFPKEVKGDVAEPVAVPPLNAPPIQMQEVMGRKTPDKPPKEILMGKPMMTPPKQPNPQQMMMGEMAVPPTNNPSDGKPCPDKKPPVKKAVKKK